MIIHDHNNAINTVYRNSSYPIIMIICFDNEIMLFRLFSLSKVIYLKIMSFIFVKFVKWNYFDGVEGGGKKVKYDGVRWEGVVSNSQNKKNIYNYHCFFLTCEFISRMQQLEIHDLQPRSSSTTSSSDTSSTPRHKEVLMSTHKSRMLVLIHLTLEVDSSASIWLPSCCLHCWPLHETLHHGYDREALSWCCQPLHWDCEEEESQEKVV